MLIEAVLGVALAGVGQIEQMKEVTPPRPVSTPVAPSPPVAQDANAGEWLTHLARHQGHRVGRSDPRSASLQVMALLRAAVDVSPNCAEAFFWLYDLEHRMDRHEEARKALAQYVRLTPGDDAARIRLFELEIEDRHTSEDRAKFVKEQLKRKPLTRAFESELHRWLARHYHERQESKFAGREIEHALRMNPMNIAARELAYEMFGETEPNLQRVEMALQLISVNPSQANLVWDLAEFLDGISLPRRAQEWYNRAIDLHTKAGAGEVPAEYWHKLAVSYASSKDYELAVKAAGSALRINPELHTARLLRAFAQSKLGKPDAARVDRQFVADAYAKRIDDVVAANDFNEAATIAWFFAYHEPDPARALQLAELAMRDPNPSSLARVAYGHALQLNGRTSEAMKILEPLAESDQLAAHAMARMMFDQGRDAPAKALLHKAAARQHSGIGYEMIAELLDQHGDSAPKPPLNSKVIAALDRFKRDVFDYHADPSKFLKFTMNVKPGAEDPMNPINAVFRIENVGPFPISFGDGFMARPLIALSAEIGSSGALFENYLQVLMNARPTLLPGDAIQKTVTLDVGAIQKYLIERSTEQMPVSITAVFDPVYVNGKLSTGMGSIQVGPIQVARRALDTTGEGFAAALRRGDSPNLFERMRAAREYGALLACYNASNKPKGIDQMPVEAFRNGLATLLKDQSWQVQAHAIVAAGWSPLDPIVTASASQCVGNRHPVVKMLAVRLFAEQHGPKFKQVLQKLSKSDPVDYVRMIASSYLPPASRTHAWAPSE